MKNDETSSPLGPVRLRNVEYERNSTTLCRGPPRSSGEGEKRATGTKITTYTSRANVFGMNPQADLNKGRVEWVVGRSTT
jgi:hypothetical protein